MDTPTQDTPTQDTPKWAEERIAKIAAQKAEALSRVAELEAKIAELSPLAEAGSAWEAKFTELETSSAKARSEWSSERELLQAGVRDPEIRELYQWQYSKIAEEGRAPFGEWVKGLTAENAPATLRAHLPTSSSPAPAVTAPTPTAPATTAPTPSAPPVAPKSEAATLPSPTPSHSLSADEIRGTGADNWASVRERLKAEYARR